MTIKSITPFLWFDACAEEAVNFYVSLFPDSKVTHVSRYGDTGPGPKGSAMVVAFQLCGRPFLALNGGPHQKLSEAFSLMVECTDQADIDRLEKTDTEVTLPILPVLTKTLAAGPCGDLAFIINANGQPFTKESFGNAFTEACPWVLGRTVSGVKNGPSPEWLRKRLESVT